MLHKNFCSMEAIHIKEKTYSKFHTRLQTLKAAKFEYC